MRRKGDCPHGRSLNEDCAECHDYSEERSDMLALIHKARNEAMRIPMIPESIAMHPATYEDLVMSQEYYEHTRWQPGTVARVMGLTIIEDSQLKPGQFIILERGNDGRR